MKGEIEPGAFITAESGDDGYKVVIRCSSMESMHKAHRAVLELVYDVRQPQRMARHQPCGCVICRCEHDERCLGCGAKNCGTHPAGEIPNPVYENAEADHA